MVIPELAGRSLTDFARIVIFSGAGLSAESGVPTYRGKGGTWEKYDYTEYACEDAFLRDPEAVWEFHNKRRLACAEVEPNFAHEVVAQLQSEAGATVVTQNIDGLQQRAGAVDVLELHGSLWRVRHPRTGEVFEMLEPVILDDPRFEDGAWMRPDITWFGDSLREDVVQAASKAIAGCELLISIGTSGVVYPAAALPQLAQRAGAFLIEVNPEETPMSALYDVCLRAKASEAMQALWEAEDLRDLLA